MVPNLAEHRRNIVPGRLLGEPWAALGQASGPWRAKADLRAILGALGIPFGGSKMLENVLESH